MVRVDNEIDSLKAPWKGIRGQRMKSRHSVVDEITEARNELVKKNLAINEDPPVCPTVPWKLYVAVICLCANTSKPQGQWGDTNWKIQVETLCQMEKH